MVHSLLAPEPKRTGDAHPLRAALAVTVTGYVVLVVAMLAIGLVLTHALDDSVGRWDTSVNRWFVDRRTTAWNDITGVATFMINTEQAIGLAALICGVLALRRRWREAAMIVLALALELVVFLSVTFVVARPRPDVVRMNDTPATSSFPSGHTAATVALWCGLALGLARTCPGHPLRVLSWVLAVVFPVFVLCSRLYRGMHWPTDVAASVIFALLWLFLLRAVLLPPDRANAPRAPLRR
jgi:membrane-associated phospholipid phosphatase